MRKTRTVFGLGVVMLVMVLGLGEGCKMLGLAPSTQADVKAYAKTLQGLNEDMRETLLPERGPHAAAET